MPRGQRAVDTVDVQVKGNHCAVTPDMRSHVVRKMQRLQKYMDRLSAIEVELSEEDTRSADHRNQVEATTRVAGRTIRVKAQHEDMLAAVDETVDKLYRQLNRQKERMKAHNNAKLSEVTASMASAEETPMESEMGDGDFAVSPVRVERLDMKPQFEDEALEALESSEKSFYVFLNASNEEVNVLYRRDDGSYSLIQPRL